MTHPSRTAWSRPWRATALLLLLVLALPARAAPLPIVAVAHRQAAEAAQAMLAQGGNALDAAVAAQAMLGLVEPQSSGLGGGAYLLFYEAASRRITAWDGRETAPAAAGPDLFLGPDGAPLPFATARIGGRAVGAPGVIPMLEAAHRAAGHLPWPVLFGPAIRAAEAGFPVSPRLAAALRRDAADLARQPALRALFFGPDGAPLAAGVALRNPALADALRQVAAHGAAALTAGPIADEIAAAVQTDAQPGRLSRADLAAYRPQRRPPVCLDLPPERLCSMGPSSSGGVAVLQTLGILAALGPAPGADPAFLLAEAERLAFADRDRYLADPDFVPMPLSGLLDPAYLRGRAALIDPARALPAPPPGLPPGAPAEGGTQPTQPEHGTSHLVIIDAAGNAVAITTTIEAPFGAHLLVHGFLLNNELTDFSFRPAIDGRPVANRVQPGKRPRSSMAPTMVLDQAGRLRAVVGSAGGTRIIGYVAQTLLALQAGAAPAAAVAAPHIGVVGGTVELEAGTEAAAKAPALRALGEVVRVVPMVSGTQAVVLLPDGGAVGGADPRREGVVLGGAP